MLAPLKKRLSARRKTYGLGGYTIIEVMIFLTVSVGLFATAVVAISEQNRRIAFTQSVRDVELKLQDVFNDVENGYYPASDLKQQGTDEDHIFIGKAVQFGRPEKLDLIATSTIFGDRLNSKEEDVKSLEEASPRLLEYETNDEDIYNIESEVKIKGFYYGKNSTFSYSGLAIITGFAEESGDTIESGIVRPSFRPVLGSSQGAITRDEFATQVENMPNSWSEYLADKGGTLCLQERGGGRTAAIQISVDSQRLSTNAIIDPDGAPCVS